MEWLANESTPLTRMVEDDPNPVSIDRPQLAPTRVIGMLMRLAASTGAEKEYRPDGSGPKTETAFRQT
jgi:hypothetical protein